MKHEPHGNRPFRHRQAAHGRRGRRRIPPRDRRAGALGGEGLGPAPHELLPAALAACISTTLVRYARTKGWDLGEVTVDVDYDHKSTPRRFEIAIGLTGELDEEQLARLDKVAAACPLRRSIEAGFEFAESVSSPRSRRGRRT